MIQLEKRGVLRNKFKDEFRRRPEWRVDWSTEPVFPADVAMAEESVIGDGPNSVRSSCAGSSPVDKVD
jgi:hypothetical protein